jgi:hypothetical protein
MSRFHTAPELERSNTSRKQKQMLMPLQKSTQYQAKERRAGWSS